MAHARGQLTFEGLESILMTFAIVWAILAPMTFESMSSVQDEYSHKRDFEMILAKVPSFRKFVLEECERLEINMTVPLGDITVDMVSVLEDDAAWAEDTKPYKEALVVTVKLWPRLDHSSVFAWTEMHREQLWLFGPESNGSTRSAALATALLFGSLFLTVFLYASLTATPSRTDEAALAGWKRFGVPLTVFSVVCGITGSILVVFLKLSHTNAMMVAGKTYFHINDAGLNILAIIIGLSCLAGIVISRQSIQAAAKAEEEDSNRATADRSLSS